MIQITREGRYELIETKKNIKILKLDDSQVFAWPETKAYGEMLVTSHNPHRADAILSSGRYKLYKVKEESSLTDLEHLELETGENQWQGYLLLTGLPTDKKIRSRIIPTKQVITNKHRVASL